MFLRGFLCLFFIGVNLHAQVYEKPNFKKIRKQIKKKKSDYYYLDLMKKFKRGDLKMTLKEKQYTYFGFAFQKEYQPYGASKEKKKLNKILSKNKISTAELTNILKLSNTYLKKNPFDIQIYQIQIYAYKRLRYKKEVERKLNQIRLIKEMVLSTGDGLTKKSAFHLLYVSHQKIILNALNLIQKGKHVSQKTLEYVYVKPNKNNIKRIYFNLTLCYKQSLD